MQIIAEFEDHAVDFEIYPLCEGIGNSVVRLGFTVESVDTVVEAARQAGAAILSSPASGPWGYRAVLGDPDGRRVELVQKDGETNARRGCSI